MLSWYCEEKFLCGHIWEYKGSQDSYNKYLFCQDQAVFSLPLREYQDLIQQQDL